MTGTPSIAAEDITGITSALIRPILSTTAPRRGTDRTPTLASTNGRCLRVSVARQTSVDQACDEVRFQEGARRGNHMRRRPFRLGYLVSHPIQYQAPMLRHIAQDPDIDLTVFYMSDMSVEGFYDPQFKVQVKWDVPLLGGYQHTFLGRLGGAKVTQLLRPVVVGLQRTLERARLDALWLHGYKHQVQLRAICAARRLGIPILVRGDSNVVEQSLMDKVSAQVLQRLFRKIDAFLYIGKQNRQFYAERGVGDGRLFSVPYAVDNIRFQQAVKDAAVS